MNLKPAKSAAQRVADKKTARAMADSLIRLAAAGPVEAHQLIDAGFTRAQVETLGQRAIEIAARKRPDFHHPGNTLPHHVTHAVRRSGRRGLPQAARVGVAAGGLGASK